MVRKRFPVLPRVFTGNCKDASPAVCNPLVTVYTLRPLVFADNYAQ